MVARVGASFYVQERDRKEKDMGGQSSPRKMQPAALGSQHTVLPSPLAGAPNASRAACLMLAWPGNSASHGL